MKEKKILKIFASARIFLFILLIVFVVNMYIFSLSSVRQNSMENTLFSGDIVLINKVINNKSLEYGDIVVFIENRDVNTSFSSRWNLILDDILGKFQRDRANFRLVKRIIAKGGDTVEIKDGEVFVNDVKIEEPYINQMTAKGDIEYPLLVKKDSYFVLGDNRELSKDSRFIGTIKAESIEGKLNFRLLPINKIGRLK